MQVQAYVEHKMKVQPGDLRRAEKLLRKGVANVVEKLIEDVMRTALRTGNFSSPRRLHQAWDTNGW